MADKTNERVLLISEALVRISELLMQVPFNDPLAEGDLYRIRWQMEGIHSELVKEVHGQE